MEREYLERCLDDGMSLKAIAREQGCSPGTVGYWVKRHGLTAIGSVKFAPGRRLSQEQLEPLVSRGLTLQQMAQELGTTPQTVHRCLKRSGKATKAMDRRDAVRRARAAGDSTVMLECSRHGLTEFWVGTKVTRCRACNAEGVARRRRKVKATLIAEAGGKCAVCGYRASQAALEFHHLDPATKSFGLAHGGQARSLARMREEAKKCVLLCANCHAAVEVGDLTLPVQLSSPVGSSVERR
jgi:DNA-binding CsgD family transcriptional regulator